MRHVCIWIYSKRHLSKNYRNNFKSWTLWWNQLVSQQHGPWSSLFHTITCVCENISKNRCPVEEQKKETVWEMLYKNRLFLIVGRSCILFCNIIDLFRMFYFLSIYIHLWIVFTLKISIILNKIDIVDKHIISSKLLLITNCRQ